ncbi:hypothetical protein ACIBEJ_34940 [Nonomuraea sp. NPDC050790]|uniref:hypothetical protein n=1 Tax=Nonomuraea sp. NPDC050790 TaxID=3364371 RepID=UPI0037B6EFEB
MPKHKVNIVTGPDGARFEVDGYDIARGVSGATVHIGPGGVTRIALEIYASVVESTQLAAREATFDVSLPPEAERALIALGWTPPTAAK